MSAQLRFGMTLRKLSPLNGNCLCVVRCAIISEKVVLTCVALLCAARVVLSQGGR